MMENSSFMTNSVKSVGTAAMFLALTQTIHDEAIAKQIVSKAGFRAAVTEVGGKTTFSEFNDKFNRAVIGAAINSEVIEKEPGSIHALLHAAEEAKQGIVLRPNASVSLALKIAVVRNDTWIAVAAFGQSALHYMTNHDRAGLGTMNI